MTAVPPLPYVVGQWVRGHRFYGREELLAELLCTTTGLLWVAGLRRIGKTSLLRRTEELAASPGRGTVALLWDLQGADTADELGHNLEDAFLDADEQLATLSFEPSASSRTEVVGELSRLADAARRRRHRLLLLIDEAEELIVLADQDPGLVGRLFELFATCPDLSVVMTSSPRLARLERLPGLPAMLADALRNPRIVGPLTVDDARALVRQAHLPADHRPRLEEETVTEIVARGGGHPYLLQMLAKRSLEIGDVALAARQLSGEPAVRQFLEIDLELISQADRVLLDNMLGGTAPSPEDPIAVVRLVDLGLLRATPDGRHEAANSFVAGLLSR